MPVVALCLAGAWLATQALRAPLAMALASVTAMVAAGGLARRARRRTLHLAGLLVLGVAVSGFLLFLACRDPGAPGGFTAMILFLAVLGPLVPILYAMGCDPSGPEDVP